MISLDLAFLHNHKAQLPLVLCLLAATAPAVVLSQSLPGLLKSELDRNFEILKAKAEPPPYFLSYSVTEEEGNSLAASLGTLLAQGHAHRRFLDTTVRIGSTAFDNYHPERGQVLRFTSAIPLSLDNSPNQIKRALWLETDRVYRLSSRRFIEISTQNKLKADGSVATGDDFSAEQPSVASQPPKKYAVDLDDWKKKIKQWSAGFQKYPEILSSAVHFSAQREEKTLVNSEGTSVEHGRSFFRVTVSASAKAADGMDLSTFSSVEAADLKNIAPDSVIEKEVEHVAKDLTALLKAPPAEPFVGPAILSGRAAAVFFHEIFGHRIEGHRQKDPAEGQTFAKRLNEPVLPNFLNVIFDPTRSSLNGLDLNGSYEFDDEGVKTRPVTVVEKGILKTFLLSRSPVGPFHQSNGHGRRQPGREVVSRQSNLIVESSKQVSDTKLREMLVAEVKRQSKPYGLYFDQVTGGYTTTRREGLQAFTVIPLVVYRVYADGRPDELIRGVNIVGTPLASFEKILATSDKSEIFNGYCGAESGSVPVSAISPALLVSEIEIQKKRNAQDKPPLLSRPPAASQSASRVALK